MKDVYENSIDLRTELIKYVNRRIIVRGRFSGYSYDHGVTEFEKIAFERTILFTDIRSVKGDLLSDHMWLHSKKFDKEFGELKSGDIVEFCTVPKYYSKYKNKVYIKNELVRVNTLNIGFEKIENIWKV